MTILAVLAAASLSSCPFADAAVDPVAYLQEAGRAEVEVAVTCLGHSDPVVRDKRTYEAFFQTLRDGTFPADLRGDLGEALAEEMAVADGGEGFAAPFAALVMAEVARTDRIDPWLSETDLRRLVLIASDYLRAVKDYRGFTEGEGWRHGVAHGADLMMQLSLNPRVDAVMADTMLDAIAAQAGPDDHAYQFGEPARLARAVIYLADGESVSHEDWEAWFDALYPAQEAEAPGRFEDAAALNRIHNLRAFALEIMAMSGRLGDSPALALHDMAFALARRAAY